MMKLYDFKILVKGAIGSMTFGAYHMYITTNMINENNRNIQLLFDENNRNNQLRIDESEDDSEDESEDESGYNTKSFLEK